MASLSSSGVLPFLQRAFIFQKAPQTRLVHVFKPDSVKPVVETSLPKSETSFLLALKRCVSLSLQSHGGLNIFTEALHATIVLVKLYLKV